MSVTVYLAGYALGQIPYGFLANRWGRKKTIYFGMLIFILGSLICAGTHSFSGLISGRAVMAIGSSVGLIMAFTLVSDFFEEREARRVLAYLTLSGALAPGLANLIGGFLTGYFGWQSCFYFFIVYAIFVVALVSRLPEGRGEKGLSAAERSAFFGQIGPKRFLLLSGMAAMATTIIYIFTATAPLIAVQVLEVAPQVYGLMSIIPMLGTAGGCLVSVRLSNDLSGSAVMKLGLSISLLGAALQWGLIKVIGMHVCSLFLPMPMIYFGLPLVYANAAALGLSNCRNKSMASGIFTLLNVGLSLLGVLLMGWIGVHSLLNVSLLFVAICSVMAFLFFLSSRAERSSLSFESPNES